MNVQLTIAVLISVPVIAFAMYVMWLVAAAWITDHRARRARKAGGA